MSFFETDKDYSKKVRGKKLRKQLEEKAIRQMKARINRDINGNQFNLLVYRYDRLYFKQKQKNNNKNNIK